MAEEIELPVKQETKEIKAVNIRHLFAGIAVIIFVFILMQHGVFGTIDPNTQYMLLGGSLFLMYFMWVKQKPIGLIPFDKAVFYGEQIVLWHQRRGASNIPQGTIQPTAKLRLRRYNGKPIQYEILFNVLDVYSHLLRPVLVKIDCWTAYLYSIAPKPEGWEPDEAPDYHTIAVPQGLYPQFFET